MKTGFKHYLVKVFFISWLLFGLLYLDRSTTNVAVNWFSYTGFLAFLGYLIYSLKKEAGKK